MCFHAGFIGAGWAGVQVFFVLSGFLITSILVAERNASLADYLRRFYWRRILRIFPVYWTFIAIITAIGAVVGFSAAYRQQILYLVTYTHNFAKITPGYIYPKYWGHLW